MPAEGLAVRQRLVQGFLDRDGGLGDRVVVLLLKAKDRIHEQRVGMHRLQDRVLGLASLGHDAALDRYNGLLPFHLGLASLVLLGGLLLLGLVLVDFLTKTLDFVVMRVSDTG